MRYSFVLKNKLMLPMENISTLKKTMARAYQEVMRMDEHEIVDRFGDDLNPGKFVMSNIMSYSRAMNVARSKTVGEIIYLMN